MAQDSFTSIGTEFCNILFRNLNAQATKEIDTNLQLYVQQYGTSVGYTPTQNAIVLNPDGSISFNLPVNGQTVTQNVGAFCCETSVPKLIADFNKNYNPSPFPSLTGEDIFWDNNEQKCRWKAKSETGGLCSVDTFKIVLNPNGNDGSIFEVDDDKKECKLVVEFDYLFKLDCQTLADILNPKETQVSVDPRVSDMIKKLESEILQLEADCEKLNSDLQSAIEQFNNSYYSIFCDNIDIETYLKYAEAVGLTQSAAVPESRTTVQAVSASKSSFGKTGFNTTSPFSFPALPNTITPITIEPEQPLTVCLLETPVGNQQLSGLQAWEQHLGPERYQRFLNGDPTSYQCFDVIEFILKANEAGETWGFECNTPFGFKTELKQEIDVYTKEASECDKKLRELQAQLDSLTVETPEETTTIECKTPTDVLETLDVSATIDIIETNGNLTSVFEDNFFPAIGAGNLFGYMTEHPTDSGFYICGEPKPSETFSTGCTAIVYQKDELAASFNSITGELLTPVPSNCESEISADYYCNVQACIPVKDNILKSLFTESQLPDDINGISVFKDSLAQTILASNWVTYSTEITDPQIIDKIKNKKITLTLKVNDSCSDICVLIDNIKLNKICVDGEAKTIRVDESPGFELERIIDNKKSWINNTTPTERLFDIKNIKGFNRIRHTEYDVNDERLVINSKEIDLDINLAKAVEHDVWCYITDNPCLLTGETIVCTGFTVTDYSGNTITLPTAQTSADCSLIIDNCIAYYTECDNDELPTIECNCGKVFKAYAKDTINGALWITCSDSKLNFYYVSDVSDVQGTITNISESFTEECLDKLTSFVDLLKQLSQKPKHETLTPFWGTSLTKCDECCKNCGDETLDFTELTTEPLINVDSVEEFQKYTTSQYIDAKNRKTISSYPTLKALYERYLNSLNYCETESSKFNYEKMDKFAALVGDYWTDIIEQVVPATTIWGSVKIYTNTIFDQQKFKYRNGSLFYCIDNECNLNEVDALNECIGSIIDQYYTDECPSEYILKSTYYFKDE